MDFDILRLPMKRFFFVAIVFAFLLVGGISVSAQKAAPLPPPAPVPDYFPLQWKEYSFAEDNIRFRFPVEPKRQERFVGTGKHVAHLYRHQSFMLFDVSVIFFPDDYDLGSNADVLENAIQGGLDSVKEFEPKILEQEDSVVDGHPSRFVLVESNHGLILRLKTFTVKNRLYTAMTVTEKGKPHGFNSENDFEVIAMAFLDSVRPIEAK